MSRTLAILRKELVDMLRDRRTGMVTLLSSLDRSVPMEVYADGERVGPLPGTMEAVRDALNVRVPLLLIGRCKRSETLMLGSFHAYARLQSLASDFVAEFDIRQAL